jgi:hypothetical protein
VSSPDPPSESGEDSNLSDDESLLHWVTQEHVSGVAAIVHERMGMDGGSLVSVVPLFLAGVGWSPSRKWLSSLMLPLRTQG